MAITWPPKAPGEVREYTWTPKLGEGVSSKTLTVSTGTATITSAIEGEDVAVTVTGGADDVVQIITASAVLGNGETITETIYVAVMADTNRLGNTVRDVCSYALRKVIGSGDTANPSELADAMERLNDMLAAWRGEGADIGVPLPVDASDTLYIADAFVQGVKANLIISLSDLYNVEVTQSVARDALRGLQRIKTALLSADRGTVAYY